MFETPTFGTETTRKGLKLVLSIRDPSSIATAMCKHPVVPFLIVGYYKYTSLGSAEYGKCHALDRVILMCALICGKYYKC